MCGRYRLAIPLEELVRIFGVAPDAGELRARWNVAPTDVMPIVASDRLRFARWGFRGPWEEDRKGTGVINARAETVATKPMFRAAFRRGRCIVPADGFYEWRKVGKERFPVMYRPVGTPVLAMAGLWEHGADPPTFTVLTTDANALCAQVHDRMPVILPPGVWRLWLDPATPPDALERLCAPAPEGMLEAIPVSRAVNNVRNDSPEVVEPASGGGYSSSSN